MNQSEIEKTEKTGTSNNELANNVTFMSGLVAICGTAAILLSFWVAICTGGLLGKNIYTLLYVDGFEPATFTIEKISFFKGNNSSNRTYDKYWADGDINGSKEKFGLGSYISGVIQSQEDLEKQVSVGQKLPVLYNPEAPSHLEIRVQFPEKDLKKTLKRRQEQIFNTAYLPWLSAIGLCLFFGVIARKMKMAIGFSIGSMFFVVFAWIPTLLNLL